MHQPVEQAANEFQLGLFISHSLLPQLFPSRNEPFPVHGFRLRSIQRIVDENLFFFGLKFEPLFVEELVLLVPITHPLAKEEMIAEDLRGERLVLTGRNCAYRRKFENRLLEKGNSVFPIIQTGSIESLKRLVQAGCGIGIIPRVSVSSPPAGTVFKSVRDLELDVTMGILHRFDQYVSRAMESMIDALRVSLQDSQ